jgi:type II secretory ATPase GspE/PulE/Tfp pilus assembly ATPase PilB-like protein
MIGEIRDGETAENAIRTSLAGKIIFSTIHANTVIGTVARLVDMDIDRSLIAYAVNGVISQRLVRKNCPNCKTAYSPSKDALAYFGLDERESRFVRGRGCAECAHAGFLGRVGIFEFFKFDTGLRSLVVEKASMADLQAYVEKAGMKSLIQSAKERILAGITTPEEAMRAV